MASASSEVVIPYSPRAAFLPFHERTQRWASLVVHRRGGKTVASINELQKKAITNGRKWPPPKYAYVAPYYNQAKRIAWGYAKHYADPIPGREFNESELKIIYPNGAELRLFGADNPDALRGDYLDGVVPDEYSDWNPSVWPLIIRPMLADFGGWAAFIGTPKGRNDFFRLHTDAENDPANWFTLKLKASESGLIAPAELDDLRRGMSEDQFAQEFECSFDAAIQGAYYAQLLREAEAQGRICNVAQDPIMRLRAYWDIGGPGKKADAMTVVIAQFVGKEIRVLDGIEGIGQVLAYYVNELRARGYSKALCVLPHDAAQTHADNPTGIDFESQLQQAGFETKKVHSPPGIVMQRISTARRYLPRMWFNKPTTQGLRDALQAYAEKRHEKTGEGLGPNHNWASHYADAFGLMSIDYEEPKDAIDPNAFYSKSRHRGEGGYLSR